MIVTARSHINIAKNVRIEYLSAACCPNPSFLIILMELMNSIEIIVHRSADNRI